MLKQVRKLTPLAIPFFLCSFATGQDDPAKQKAIEQMRQISDAIKQCPEKKVSHEDECQVYHYFLGPPTNVEWNVLPSKTVRSPFQGVIEFSLPSRGEFLDKTDLPKKIRQKCINRQALTASATAEAIKDGPKWNEGHYRYEFDLGSGIPELIKMLWIVKDKDNNTITSAATSDPHACWVTAAKANNSPNAESTPKGAFPEKKP
jgi:hypothetical protein